MILVTLGTQDKSFDRLLKAIDKEIENKNIKEKVIVQAGYTKYKSNNMEIFDLVSEEKLEKLVKKCDLLITHGGVGSILLGIRNNKKVIVAARLKKYGEHTNDHQKQIIKEFNKLGYITELDDFKELNKVIKQAKEKESIKFKSNNDRFVKNVEKYIEEDNHISWLNKFRNLSSFGYQGIVLNLINLFFFSLVYFKYNIYISVFVSYFLTLLINILFNKFLDIKSNIKETIVVQVTNLILSLILIYAFNNIIRFNLIYLKLLINIFIMIVSLVIIKLCFRKRD
mgnify:CR=1 FL=1